MEQKIIIINKFLLFSFTLLFTTQIQAGVLGGILGAIKGAAKGIAKQYGISYEALGKATEQIDKINEEISIARNTYDSAKNQLSTIKEMKALAQKKYQWGDLLNSATDLRKLKYTADSWGDTVNSVGKNSNRYQQMLEHYTKQHNDITENDYVKGASKEKYQKYQESKKITANADTQATTAFNDTNKRLDNIHKLSKKIGTSDSQKSSADLNARLVAENAYVQAEVLRQVAILNKQSALSNERQLQIEAQKARETAKNAEFNRLPDE